MEVVTTVGELRSRLDRVRSAGRRVGFVPTMGYLHEGHLSLVRAAAAANDEVVVSIFVNPLQFAAGEDLDAYPSDPEGDHAAVDAEGATVVFRPSREEMYPGGDVVTSVSVDALAMVMEGASRPTHFAGVCTVVAKLFNIVGPCRAYFGEKDYQQLAVVRRMAVDLSFPVEVVGCPTRRDPDGLALSSRNVYLGPEERRDAPVLHRALQEGARMIRGGERDADAVRRAMAATVAAAPTAELDYVEVADPESLEPLATASPRARLFGAASFGRARLIDNVPADPGDAA